LEVHLISDLQKSAMPAGFTDVRLDQDTEINFHAVGKLQPNWAVENVIAPQHVYDPKRVRISATVTGFSAEADSGMRISIRVPPSGLGTLAQSRESTSKQWFVGAVRPTLSLSPRRRCKGLLFRRREGGSA